MARHHPSARSPLPERHPCPAQPLPPAQHPPLVQSSPPALPLHHEKTGGGGDKRWSAGERVDETAEEDGQTEELGRRVEDVGCGRD